MIKCCYDNPEELIDDGILTCLKCGTDVEFSEQFKTEPIIYDEEVYPEGVDADNYDGPWPPPGTTIVQVQDGNFIYYKCPNCNNEWKVVQ